MFDTFVMVDWSAASVPRTGRDSIWICWIDAAGERLVNPATRHAAKTLLAEWLSTAMSRMGVPPEKASAGQRSFPALYHDRRRKGTHADRPQAALRRRRQGLALLNPWSA